MNRADYVKNVKEGDLIAFKFNSLEAKMYSGKITKLGNTRIEVETKNGKKFFVDRENIQWVNTTGRWPSHIIQALKGIDADTDGKLYGHDEKVHENVTEGPEIV